MILDDEEMEDLTKRVDWRGKNSFEVRSLFVTARTSADFPSAFQRPVPKEFPELTPAEFPSLGAPVQRPSAQRLHPQSYRQILLQEKKPEPSKEFKPLLNFTEYLELTPEFIAAFGVPLLPMPSFENPYIDEDGDYRYAACTPPPERVEACEAT